jgi:hypothetical protein
VIIYPLIVYSIASITLFSPSTIELQAGWKDDQFKIWYKGLEFYDSFTEGWTVAWRLGQEEGESCFENGRLYATFKGYNTDHERGVSGIMVQKPVKIDTTFYPYVVIRHKESSSDPALMFSFGVTDEKGNWYDAGWYHTSVDWTYLEIDMSRIYLGNITSISVRLTNDFDPTYSGGMQSAYIESICFYKEPPDWSLVYLGISNTSISSKDGTLTISVNGEAPKDSMVVAQKKRDLNFDPSLYPYLKVSIRTSSINVATRIVLWTDPEHAYTVLLKTYNDGEWHTEIIDLRYFGIASTKLYMIELSLLQLSDGINSSVSYRELSFNRMVRKP